MKRGASFGDLIEMIAIPLLLIYDSPTDMIFLRRTTRFLFMHICVLLTCILVGKFRRFL